MSTSKKPKKLQPESAYVGDDGKLHDGGLHGAMLEDNREARHKRGGHQAVPR